MLEEIRRAWREAGDYYGKRPPKKPRSRNYHMAMIAVDAFFAIVFAMTIVLLPLSFVFIFAIMKRYDTYLR